MKNSQRIWLVIAMSFTGFPSADNPYAPGIPYGNSPYNTPLIILTTIKPK